MIFNKHFSKYYLKYFIPYLLGVIALVVTNFSQLVIPEQIGKIIDEYSLIYNNTSAPLTNIYKSLKIILIAAGITVICRFLWRYLIFGTSRKIEEDIRQKMFDHATKLSTEFYSRNKVGALMTYFTNDLWAVRMVYGPGILMLVDGLVLGSLTLYKMFKLNILMTGFAFIPLLIIGLISFLMHKSIHKTFKARQQSFEDLTDITQENFSGLQVIKAFVSEAISSLRFKNRANDYYNKNMQHVKKQTLLGTIINSLLITIVLFIIGFSAFLVIDNKLTVGQTGTYISYFFTLFWPIMAIVRIVVIANTARASANRIANFLETPIIVNDDKAISHTVINGSNIEFKNLSFSFPDDPNNIVLKDISFKINDGENVGILGRTGSGKSTLVDLILRLYNVKEETLFIDGKDIMKIPLNTLRDAIGYVPQDNFLFSDSIKNNIGFSYTQPSEEIISKSAKLADIYDNIIEFKEGFETVLGERGVTVSGGQKQRISIARALAKDPKILILDDSVSAVDTETEKQIIKNLKNVRKGKTTIFIAHRISTVKNMDKIILFDKGRLVAIGNHNELLEKSTLYKEMVDLQTLVELDIKEV